MVAVMADQTDRLSSHALRYVEAELATYPLTKRAIAERTADLIGGSGQAFDEQVVIKRTAGSHSDPTGFRGSLLCDDVRLRSMQRTVHAIDETVERLPDKAREFVTLYYWSTRSMNVPQVAARLGVSAETAYRWRHGVRVAVASRLGLT